MGLVIWFAFVILFATYGMFILISDWLDGFRQRRISSAASKGICKCVLLVKNRESDIEWLIHKARKEILPMCTGTPNALIVVDLKSTDETLKILGELNCESGDLLIKSCD